LEANVNEYEWSKLTKPQLGKYAEYFAKMEFTRCGLDVYTAEVDDKGIDFVIRLSSGCYFDVQVKSVRDRGLVCFPLHVFTPRPNLMAAIVVFPKGRQAEAFLIPSTEWINRPSGLLAYYKSKEFDEYQLRVTSARLDLLRRDYSFAHVVHSHLEATATVLS
jgi:hypothetical protein